MAGRQAENFPVRRQRDATSVVVSLWKIMTENRKQPEVCSRQRYVPKFYWGMQYLGDADFDALHGQGRDQIDKTQVEIISTGSARP